MELLLMIAKIPEEYQQQNQQAHHFHPNQLEEVENQKD